MNVLHTYKYTHVYIYWNIDVMATYVALWYHMPSDIDLNDE